MEFQHLNRRLHLYLGLALSPWILLYAVSSIPFSHGRFFEDLDKAKGRPNWTRRAEIPFDAPVPREDSELRAFGLRIMRTAGLQGAFGAYRQGPSQINVYSHSVWNSTQVKYLVEEKKLIVEDKRFRWDHMLTGFHAKGGFEQESCLHDSWGVVVDLVSLGLILWVASGLYMWIPMRNLRRSGLFALAAGALSFGALLWLL
jgi:hypothetical protein